MALSPPCSRGAKFLSGEIFLHGREEDGVPDPDAPTPLTVLEIAGAMAKITGLVATSDITHATPTSLGAHVHNRICEYELARPYFLDTEVDVLLGGGIASYRRPCLLPHTAGSEIDALVDSAAGVGYSVVADGTELNATVASGGGSSSIIAIPFEPGWCSF